MQRPAPVNSCVDYGIHELFFSTTNPKGVIRSGNDIFVRVSQYTKEQLANKPHSIIRHPDMPKLVFQVLWDTIKAGNSIGAYVKNLAMDGRYYWVFASVFPIQGGYLSIRLKPTSAIFGLMPDVYKAMLAAEKSGGVEASLAKLVEILHSKGFKSYESFMTTALIEELKSRDILLEKEKRTRAPRSHHLNPNSETDKLYSTLEQIQRTCGALGSHYANLFRKIDSFLDLGNTLEVKSALIISLAQEISMLSLNASIEASQTGSMGATLSMVSTELRDRSDEAKKGVKAVNDMASSMIDEIKRIAFKIATSRIQVEMISCFSNELLEKAIKQKIQGDELAEIQMNCLYLLKTLQQTSREAISALRGFVARLAQLDIYLEKLESVVMALEVVRKTGIIESARLGKRGQNFSGLFDQMISSVSSAKKELNDFRESTADVKGSILDADSADVEILNALNRVIELVYSMYSPEVQEQKQSAAMARIA